MFFAFTLSYLSCLGLCMAMQRHFQQLWPQKKLSPPLARLFSTSGWLLLLGAIILAAQFEGIAVGLVFSAGLFSAAAFMLILLLNFAARAALITAALLILLSVVLLV